MSIFPLALLISLPLFLQASVSRAALTSCEQINAISDDQVFFEEIHWIELKDRQPDLYKLHRQQAEITKLIEANHINTDAGATLTDDAVKAMSDEQLDEAGQGIYFANYKDAAGDAYQIAQIGFGERKVAELFFKTGTAQLGTHLYVLNGKCTALPASPYTPAAPASPAS